MGKALIAMVRICWFLPAERDYRAAAEGGRDLMQVKGAKSLRD